MNVYSKERFIKSIGSVYGTNVLDVRLSDDEGAFSIRKEHARDLYVGQPVVIEITTRDGT